jgi:type III pantothenate kinase
MLLTIDIGNTNMVLGVFQGDTIVEHWRVATVPDRTADEIAALLHGLLAQSTVVREGSRSQDPPSTPVRATYVPHAGVPEG